MNQAPSATVFRLRSLLGRSNGNSGGGAIVLLLAAVTGICGGFATVCFRDGIAGLQKLLVGHSSGLVEMAMHLSPVWRVVIPVCGGVLAGTALVIAGRHAASHGGERPNDYMHAASVGDGHVPVVQSLLRALSSLLTIASGGSIGREGAMVQLAALSGSLFGLAICCDSLRLRLLVACGAAAGLTAAYNAPIASAFFVSEIVLGTFAIESFAPILVAAVASNLLMRALPGYHPTYTMPTFPTLDAAELPFMILLGLIGGFGASWFLRALQLGRRLFARMNLPLPLKLGAGGLGVGLISLWIPQVWGNGYSVTNSLLNQQWVWTSVLTILVAKVVATAITTGSGAIGGIFTPTLFVGATVGWLFGTIVNAWLPGSFPPDAFAVVGMGTFLAAASGAPIMAILMIFEMTLSYEAMLPLMVACVVAWSCARALGAPAMYEAVLKRQAAILERSRLERSTVASLVCATETVVHLDAPFAELMRMFLLDTVKYLYVVDEDGRFVGAVALQDLVRTMLEDPKGSSTTAGDYLKRDFPWVLADCPIVEALERMQSLHAERIPVVDGPGTMRLLGVIRKSEVMNVLSRLMYGGEKVRQGQGS